MDDMMLRHVQLGVRLAEVDGILLALRQLMQGQGRVSTGPTSSPYEWDGWHVVELAKPIIAGHSFGGSLAVSWLIDIWPFACLTRPIRWRLPWTIGSTLATSSRLILLFGVCFLAPICPLRLDVCM